MFPKQGIEENRLAIALTNEKKIKLDKKEPELAEKAKVILQKIYDSLKLDVQFEVRDKRFVFSGDKMFAEANTFATSQLVDAYAYCEINLDDLISKLPELKEISENEVIELAYKKPSAYPFIVRDVALFVSPAVSPVSVQKIIAQAAGSLVVKGPTLFDRFEKGDKVSLAYRMVFQSYDRTLSDSETNDIMNAVIAALEREGYEVRK